MNERIRTCPSCQKPLNMDVDKYTTIWDLPNIYFVHYECGEILIKEQKAEEINWAEKAAKKIMNNLNDRNLGLDHVDEDTLIEIKKEMIEIIRTAEREGKK